MFTFIKNMQHLALRLSDKLRSYAAVPNPSRPYRDGWNISRPKHGLYSSSTHHHGALRNHPANFAIMSHIGNRDGGHICSRCTSPLQVKT